MSHKPEDQATLLIKLSPSKDWIATFWCVNCSTHHHMLLLKQRVHYKAVLIENSKAHKEIVTPYGSYKCVHGSPDEKILDDIEANFGPEDDDGAAEGSEDDDA